MCPPLCRLLHDVIRPVTLHTLCRLPLPPLCRLPQAVLPLRESGTAAWGERYYRTGGLTHLVTLPSAADGKEPALPLFILFFLISKHFHSKYIYISQGKFHSKHMRYPTHKFHPYIHSKFHIHSSIHTYYNSFIHIASSTLFKGTKSKQKVKRSTPSMQASVK